MDDSNDRQPETYLLGRIVSIIVIASAVLSLALVIWLTAIHPRTDDATVLANFIGIAPVVEGPVVRLAVQDNQFVHKGELLYEIDDLPYRYALQQALSEQAALEGNIRDQSRQIAGQTSAVVASRLRRMLRKPQCTVPQRRSTRRQPMWYMRKPRSDRRRRNTTTQQAT
ncbi:biotin/lipoyl-binding protein [Tunturiibacter lichenicola]|uniref:biotin/lipoyl-binding protein n=1 Tax=Tunturiibacter lichenicola TaxID=2051959 RepID=UPI003D9B98A5